jgi:hypothetical protein
MKLAWEEVVCVQNEQRWGRGGGDGPKANSRRFAHRAENKGATCNQQLLADERLLPRDQPEGGEAQK